MARTLLTPATGGRTTRQRRATSSRPGGERGGTLPGVRALVLGNGDDLDPGFIGQRFRERGYVFSELHREHPDAWPSLDGVELVLTLGSEWHVLDPARAEAVAAEADLIRRVREAGVALFAICYGAQLLAHALGATVTPLEQPEIGWIEVEPAAPGEDLVGDVAGDPDRAPPVALGPWMSWHSDGFDVPAGFRELARTDAGPQLIVGERTLATQFHPEATETVIARWLRTGGAEQLRAEGGEPTELLGQTRTNVELSRPNAESLVDWFLTDVAPS